MRKATRENIFGGNVGYSFQGLAQWLKTLNHNHFNTGLPFSRLCSIMAIPQKEHSQQMKFLLQVLMWRILIERQKIKWSSSSNLTKISFLGLTGYDPYQWEVTVYQPKCPLHKDSVAHSKGSNEKETQGTLLTHLSSWIWKNFFLKSEGRGLSDYGMMFGIKLGTLHMLDSTLPLSCGVFLNFKFVIWSW